MAMRLTKIIGSLHKPRQYPFEGFCSHFRLTADSIRTISWYGPTNGFLSVGGVHWWGHMLKYTSKRSWFGPTDVVYGWSLDPCRPARGGAWEGSPAWHNSRSGSEELRGGNNIWLSGRIGGPGHARTTCHNMTPILFFVIVFRLKKII